MNQLNPEFRRSLTDSGFPPFIRLADDLENTPPSVGIRLNPRKPGAVPPEGARPVPWHPRAYLLDTRPEFTLDPAMHQGAYYVQDPSSMFVAEILRQILPDLPPRPRVLDLCAAPGGKSTALADLLPDGSLLVSNEYDFRRAEILKENIIKWGYPWSIVTRGDTSRFRRLPGYFDLIVVDAPCSGEGMSRKDPKAREQWSPTLVAQCASLQEEILANAAAALRPGGYLIYSTCTFNTAENEARTAPLLAPSSECARRKPSEESGLPDCGEAKAELHPGSQPPFSYCPIEVNPAWGILTEAPEPTPYPSLRFLPGRVEGEGYTVALLRKNGAADPSPAPLPAPSPRGKKQSKGAPRPAVKHPEAELLSRVPASLGARLVEYREGELAAIPAAIHPDYLALSPHLDIIHAGITLAETKGRDYLPTPSLAMCARRKPSEECAAPFPEVEVATPEALDYLRRQALTLPPGTPKGYVLLTHRPAPGAAPLPLGFVKNLGNRANNLYPAPWRILRQ